MKLPASHLPLGALLLAVLSGPAARSQTQPPAPAATPRPATLASAVHKHEFGVWTGASFASTHLRGFSNVRRLFITGLRYSRAVRSFRSFNLRYVVDAIPVAVLAEPAAYNLRSERTAPGWQYVYGGGISPMGFQANFRPRKKAQPFAGSSGGFLYFQRKVFSAEASQFNFTFDFSGGVQIFTSPRRAVTLGYSYRHISNADITPRNPGTDAYVVYVGWSFFR